MFQENTFIEVCRLCLTKNKVNVSIFDDSIEENNILTKIHSCLPIKISEEDELPKKICDDCSFKVETFFQFRKNSVFSEKKLLTSLENNNLPFIDEEEKRFDASDQKDLHSKIEIKEELIDFEFMALEEPCLTQNRCEQSSTSTKDISSEYEDPPTWFNSVKMEKQTDISSSNMIIQPNTRKPPKEKKTARKPKTPKVVKPKIVLPNLNVLEWSTLCDICGKTLSSREKLRLHRFIHTGYKPHACKVCPKKFLQLEQLKAHERIHTGEKPYICRFCGKAFTQCSPLRIHERMHTGETPYKCVICNEGFISKSRMNTHLKKCTGTSN